MSAVRKDRNSKQPRTWSDSAELECHSSGSSHSFVPPFYALTPSGLSPRLLLSFAFSCRSSPSQLSSSTGSVSKEYERWSGLQSWRESPINEDRFWGANGPQPLPRSRLPLPPGPGEAAIALASSLAEMGALVLSTSDPTLKSQLSHIAFSQWRSEGLPV
ncbi:hypothetical protein MLD38_033318 [Melastoma candidum]|uniref:Uncharacterized protein n=1 Tax=Melastoma candidum TaxID=119954 RepID=A0ACB9MA32_9MYRT|nr:hypothetical protein MLD38_033318 [Melastoma candidum]